MQVNPVQSPNFGMALRITPEAIKNLQNATLDKLQTIEKIGKELADTCNVDLELGEALTPRVVTKFKSAYLPPFKFLKPNDRFLPYTATWDGPNIPITAIKGSKHTNCIKFESKEAALDAYAKTLLAPTEIDKATELTKLLSDEYKRDALTQEEIKKAEMLKKRLVFELIKKFSGKADIKQ